jgi:D-sedoheptulose 7-phosphate isomerase
MPDRDPLLEARFREQIQASIRAKQDLLADLSACLDVASVLIRAYRDGRAMLLFGNGGSAADAQHIATEFVSRFYLDRPALPAQALTVNTSLLTAIANDDSFDAIFARQLEALGRPGDVAVGLSTSGNSRNVIEGLRAARRLGMVSVLMTGATGGLAKGEADHWVSVPSDDTPRIQEAHIMIGHIWSELVEASLFGDGSPDPHRLP